MVSFEIRSATTPKPPTTPAKTSLKGTYRLRILGSTAKVTVVDATFDDKNIVFEGCNIITIPYEAYADGTFKVTGDAASTRRACEVDNDRLFINVIKGADRWEREGGNIHFIRSATNVRLFTVEGKSATVITPPTTTPTSPKPPSKVSLKGTFKLKLVGSTSKITSLDVTFDDKRINFEGCNIISFPYELSSNSGFKVTGDATSTRRACAVDNDK